MTANLHRQLLRPGRAFLGLIFLLIYTGRMPTLISAREFDGSVWAFLLPCISIPAALGILLAGMVHEPMHRPFAVLLPGAQRRFFRSHISIVVSLAVMCAGVAYAIDRAIPWVTLLGIALASLTLPLATSPGARWAGSRALFLVVVIGGFVAVAWGDKSFTIVAAHPVISGLAAFALAAFSLATTFRPGQLRQRATQPYVSTISAMGDSQLQRQLAQDYLSRQSASASRWQTTSRARSLFFWVRAVLHENFGRSKFAFLGLLGGAAFTIVFLIALSGARTEGRDLADRFYRTIQGMDGHAFALQYVFGMVFFAQITVVPRPDSLYPLSRGRRAQVTFATSFWALMTGTVMIAATTLAMSWGIAVWRGLPFALESVIKFWLPGAMLTPLIPFVQWGRMHLAIRNDQAMAAALSFFAVLLGATSTGLIRAAEVDLSSPRHIGFLILAVMISQVLYYRALRRFYLQGDLLQRGTKRQNLSLI